jgi:Domain of unknown function (DUF5615)
MLPLLSDEDVPRSITEGLRQHFPGVDVLRVQEVGLGNTPDSTILAWAANENRAVFTRDRSTMTAHARDRVRQGLSMAGVLVLAHDIRIGKAIQELRTLAQAGDPGDFDGQILFLG